jgi:two-component system cell cycle sensor histidine kinase/response regulator CckA
MNLPALLRRPRLIDQLARPLPPLLAVLFEESGVCTLVLDRDRRVVRTNRNLDALLATGGTPLAADETQAGRPGAGAAGTGTAGTGGAGAGTAAAGAAGTGGAGAGGFVAGGAAADGIVAGERAVEAPAVGAPIGAPAETLFSPADRHRVAAALAAGLRSDPLPPLQVQLNAAGPATAPVVALSVVPLREGNGGISGLLLRLIDLSVEKRLEAELAQLQKIQAVGQLAGGIAHDFNNLLTAICAAADLVLERESCEAATLDDVRQIRQSADRGAALVRQLLAFGRRQPLIPAVVPVNAAVHNLADLLIRLVGEPVHVRLELEEPGRSVRVDPSQLDQVLVNLAVNARDAMPAGGTLTLRTGHLTLYQPRRIGSETMPPGRYVAIGVEDTGEGIPPANLPLVFEPFFTTRRERGGSGLGLSTVQGIVRQSGGFVAVESGVGQGTCVRFWLPRHEEAEVVSGSRPADVPRADGSQADGSQADAPALDDRPPEGRRSDGPWPVGPPLAAPPIGTPVGQTPGIADHPPVRVVDQERYILLVEDEESVRRLTERALRRAGWQVLAVESAEAALELLPHPGGPTEPPCVLLSDIILPGMDGTGLARTVRAVWPDMPIVLVSGYTDSALLGDLLAQGVAFLTKPFRLRELVACVERAAQENAEEGSAAGRTRHVRD